MPIYSSVIDLIGHTPLVELNNLNKAYGLKARLLAKFEAVNPGGSVKDRAALYMIKEGLKSGKITKDTIIVEPTSGNTGIGLALIGASLGLKVTLVLPETMSVERRNILKAYGAELILTQGSLGMNGAIAKAEAMARDNPHVYIPQQFENEANALSHYETTGPEIWEDTEGKVDAFISAVGSAGTISGVGRYLKEQNPQVQIIAVEAENSAVLSGGKAGVHKIQGISAGFIPKNYDKSVVDKVITVSDDESFDIGRTLAQSEGLFIGISSGAAVAAAIKEAKKEENAGKTIVVILPDNGDRYLSTPLYQQD